MSPGSPEERDLPWSKIPPTAVPGFGFHLRHMPEYEFVHGRRVRFPNAVMDFHARLLTTHELTMLNAMNYITEKASWSEHVHDPDTVEQWRIEILRSPWNREGHSLSEQAFIYCIQELRDQSRKLNESGMVQVFNTPDATVVKSDTAVATQLHHDLKKELNRLEVQMEKENKVIPEAGRPQVRLLIDPSLYPLTFGRSRILSTMRLPRVRTTQNFFLGRRWVPKYKGGELWRSRQRSIPNACWSNAHQWLPADVAWGQDGFPRLRSYVNNLWRDRVDEKAYTLIEKVISASVPLWNTVLSSLGTKRPRRIWPGSYRTSCPTPPPDLSDRFARMDWKDRHSTVIGPEPTPYESASFDNGNPVNLVEDFPDGIQVIVRATSVKLTTDNPELNSDDWHIEGMMNEHICAVATFVYDEENTSGGSISFRQRSERGDFSAFHRANGQPKTCAKIFGISDGEDAYQQFGPIEHPEGRLIVYPNVLQTRATPLTLKGGSNAGHVKFLTLLLVDPYLRVLSTANILPRARDWWEKDLWTSESWLGQNRIPREIFDHIFSFVPDHRLTSWATAREEKARRDDELSRFQRVLRKLVLRFYAPYVWMD